MPAVEPTPRPTLPPTLATGELQKLFRHSSHYLTGMIASLALGLVSFPIFTRVFSVADYGTISFIQKIILLVIACSKLGMQNSAVRFYDGRKFGANSYAAGQYYSTMFFGVALSGFVVTLLFLGGVVSAPERLIDPPLAAVLYLVAVLIFVQTMESILGSFLRIEERTKAYNVVTVVKKGATIAAVCLLLFWREPSVGTYFWSAIAVETTIIATLTWLLLRRGLLSLIKFDVSLFRAAAAFGLPLVLYEAAFILLDSGDRALVRYYVGVQPLGYYSVAYGLAQYVNELLTMPLNLAMMPIYMRLWKSEGRDKTIQFLSLSLDTYLMAAAGIFAVVTVTSRDAVIFLASAKYAGAASLIPVIVAGLLIFTTHVFFGAGLIVHKKTLTLSGLLWCSAAVKIALNCTMLPRMGLQAAALATLISYALYILLLSRASFRLLPLEIRFRALLKYLFAAALASGAAALVDVTPPILNLALRSTITIALYVGTLYFIDTRAREMVERLLRRLFTPTALTSPAVIFPQNER